MWLHRGTGELQVLMKKIGTGICVSKVLQCQVEDRGKKDILLQMSSSTAGEKQNYMGKAPGNGRQFCNTGYGLCSRQRTLIGKDCSQNAKEWTEHRPVKAFVNRISYPIIVTGLSNFIFHNSSGKRPVLT